MNPMPNLYETVIRQSRKKNFEQDVRQRLVKLERSVKWFAEMAPVMELERKKDSKSA